MLDTKSSYCVVAMRPNRIIIRSIMSSSNGQNSAGLRKLLQSVLIAPADLDSFCIDYFPDVYRRFGTNLDRDHKLNLLLFLHEKSEIESCLREFEATRGAHFKADSVSVQIAPRLARGVRPTWSGFVLGGSLLLPISLTLSICVWSLLPLRTSGPNPGRPVVATALGSEVVTAAPPGHALPGASDDSKVPPMILPDPIRPPPPPRRKPPKQLSEKAIERVLEKVQFNGCPLPSSTDWVMLNLTIAPDGHVSNASTPDLGQDFPCLRARVEQASFPKFSGKPMTRKRYPLRVPHSQGSFR